MMVVFIVLILLYDLLSVHDVNALGESGDVVMLRS
jgi:hypothetical protein